MKRRAILGLIVGAAAAVGIAGAALAADKVFTGLVTGVGVGGYDVVAYQSENAAIRGDPAIEASHEGVSYRFASADNRAAFRADPEKYLPQYGGYCAWAVSQGYTAKGEPEAWTVVGGRLYLNYSDPVRAQWSQDIAGNVAKGNANWPDVLD
ncbi:YHS domain-containing protein [Nitratireductor sp. CAU 1489]|uniref:YHS domain-containing protein n=1 Tax=Nitratireductor arenosus TaxID=2682096 RepID=A0A844QF01_9HYPH|nr:YHS domain-containing (seleno)protein [Nitratireductor arenosus]MVA97184.1 YHS domain-containing protein [Nitratireductor arenosus]